MSQIPLSLPASPSYAEEDYIVSDCNRLAYQQLMAWPNWPDYGLWLYGPAHAGKSHLAAIWRRKSGALRISTNQLTHVEPLLNAAAPAYCLDGLEPLNEPMQQGLFHLLNHTKNNQKQILFVSECAPKALTIELPDLRSRMAALPTATLQSPDDALLHALWYKLFADRQLQVSPAVIDYLTARCDRSFTATARLVEQIDSAALAQKREITIPFIRSLLRPSIK